MSERKNVFGVFKVEVPTIVPSFTAYDALPPITDQPFKVSPSNSATHGVSSFSVAVQLANTTVIAKAITFAKISLLLNFFIFILF